MNRKSYNQAVQEHSDALYRYALKFCGDAVAAQDFVQDAFLKLWKGRKAVDGQKVKAWLFRTAHNAMINQWKKDRRMEGIDTLALEPSTTPNFRFELADALELALQQLPDVQRSILLLRDLEGYSYQEIAKMLEINDAQVRVYLFRARKKMKSLLQHVYEMK